MLRKKARGKVQGFVGYLVCFGTKGVVLCKPHDVEIPQDAVGVYNRE
jgi:hypothetical protein